MPKTPSMAIVEAWRTAAGLRDVPIKFNREHSATDADGNQVVLPIAVLVFGNDVTRERTSSKTRLRGTQYTLRITAKQLDEAIALTNVACAFLESLDILEFENGAIQDIKAISETHEEKADKSWTVSTDLMVRTRSRPWV